MGKRKKAWILLALLCCAVLFAPAAQAASTGKSQEQVFSYDASASQIASEIVEEESRTNLLGIVAWIVIGLGIVFILYVLLSSPKRKKGVAPSGLKYRRSPYKKRKKRIMESEYYKYKRDKYKF